MPTWTVFLEGDGGVDEVAVTTEELTATTGGGLVFKTGGEVVWTASPMGWLRCCRADVDEPLETLFANPKVFGEIPTSPVFKTEVRLESEPIRPHPHLRTSE